MTETVCVLFLISPCLEVLVTVVYSISGWRVLVSGGGTALDAGWPYTRLAVETGTTSGQTELPSVRPLQHTHSLTPN